MIRLKPGLKSVWLVNFHSKQVKPRTYQITSERILNIHKRLYIKKSNHRIRYANIISPKSLHHIHQYHWYQKFIKKLQSCYYDGNIIKIHWCFHAAAYHDSKLLPLCTTFSHQFSCIYMFISSNSPSRYFGICSA